MSLDDDEAILPPCPVCEAEMEWERCWTACDDGLIDAYDEDPVNLAPGEETYPCPECEGAGGYFQCPALPHTDAQMRAHDLKAKE